MRRSAASSTTTGIEAIDGILPMLRIIAPSGFIMAFNLGLRGPEYFHTEYPKEWQIEYERKNYTWSDPVLLWAVMRQGDKRWSEIDLPDKNGVFIAARKHGLHYGATFSRWVGVRKSILTTAHNEREFTDAEMAFLSKAFDQVLRDMKSVTSLTDVEVETLRCLRQGMDYAETAATLNISVATVKVRLDKAKRKLGCRSVAQALAAAVQRNIV